MTARAKARLYDGTAQGGYALLTEHALRFGLLVETQRCPSTPRIMKTLRPILAVAAALATVTTAGVAQQNTPEPLTSIRNYQDVSERLSSAGQIGYEQIPLLRDAGFDVVINLASASRERNGEEGFLVAESGLTYVHIPVDWEQPRLEDVDLFFDVMEANEDRKVFVHCFANMRASAFVYMYRTLVQGVPEAEALATMNEVWDPAELQQWADLIEKAQANAGNR